MHFDRKIGQWILWDDIISKDSEFYFDANVVSLVWGRFFRELLKANYFPTVLSSIFFSYYWCNNQMKPFQTNLVFIIWLVYSLWHTVSQKKNRFVRRINWYTVRGVKRRFFLPINSRCTSHQWHLFLFFPQRINPKDFNLFYTRVRQGTTLVYFFY